MGVCTHIKNIYIYIYMYIYIYLTLSLSICFACTRLIYGTPQCNCPRAVAGGYGGLSVYTTSCVLTLLSSRSSQYGQSRLHCGCGIFPLHHRVDMKPHTLSAMPALLPPGSLVGHECHAAAGCLRSSDGSGPLAHSSKAV